MASERPELTLAQDTLARILADAIVDDLLDAGGLWIAVNCADVNDQQELVARLRAEGRTVRLPAA